MAKPNKRKKSWETSRQVNVTDGSGKAVRSGAGVVTSRSFTKPAVTKTATRSVSKTPLHKSKGGAKPTPSKATPFQDHPPLGEGRRPLAGPPTRASHPRMADMSTGPKGRPSNKPNNSRGGATSSKSLLSNPKNQALAADVRRRNAEVANMGGKGAKTAGAGPAVTTTAPAQPTVPPADLPRAVKKAPTQPSVSPQIKPAKRPSADTKPTRVVKPRPLGKINTNGRKNKRLGRVY